MENFYKSLPEYIESGEYFKDARSWYKYKYIYPFSQRSFVFILSIIVCVLFAGVIININSLFPSVIQVKYSITSENSSNKSARITHANHIDNKPLESISDIMIRNYITKRESYNYEQLKNQFIYLKNNSTRIVFRKFASFMNIDNPKSPVMIYKKETKRSVNIISANYPSPSKAVVTFNSTAKNADGEIIENLIWQVIIDYEIDEIDINLPPESRFNFTVTNYQLKTIEDKLKHKP